MIVQIDELKLVYTQSWKCCTTSVFAMLADALEPDETNLRIARNKITSKHSVRLPDIRDDYYAFTVIRNPWSRMVSSFRECIKREPFGYGKGTKAGCPPDGLSWHEIYDHMNGHVCFETFVEFVTEIEPKLGGRVNSHWIPQHTFIRPDKINYNKICKLENFNQDLQQVIQEAGINIPSDKIYREYSLREYDWKVYYKYTETIQKVADYYEKDLDLFGYHSF